MVSYILAIVPCIPDSFSSILIHNKSHQHYCKVRTEDCGKNFSVKCIRHCTHSLQHVHNQSRNGDPSPGKDSSDLPKGIFLNFRTRITSHFIPLFLFSILSIG
eukprot:Gb_07670 [translate_table: standard]